MSPILVALVAETNAAERPGPHTNGTLLVVRSTGKLMYWNGGTWNPAAI